MGERSNVFYPVSTIREREREDAGLRSGRSGSIPDSIPVTSLEERIEGWRGR